MKFAAVAILFISLSSFNGVLEVINAPVTGSKIARGWVNFWTPDTVKRSQQGLTLEEGGVQKVTINVFNSGYSPKYVQVKKGIPVELRLVTKDSYSCAVDFHLKAFGIREFLQPTGEKIVTFTPTKAGSYPYTCGMGMYTGVLEVI